MKQVYQAEDGEIFDNMESCIVYEALQRKKNSSKFNFNDYIIVCIEEEQEKLIVEANNGYNLSKHLVNSGDHKIFKEVFCHNYFNPKYYRFQLHEFINLKNVLGIRNNVDMEFLIYSSL